ncbi:Mitochondrial import inner membrane translocase subunit TIM50 [Paramyrothecium foliicola]|nr:Mitochondrial import inner membrane translocase subunit TIM50 [Paramyrothecium foliicola]
MLSRAAQLSRLGSLAIQRSRPALASTSIARPAAATVSPWIRTYADKKPNSAASSSPKPSQPSGNATSPENSTSPSNSSKGAAKDAAAEDAKVPETKEDEPIPFDKLPDLTQGIPSTLEAEMEEHAGRTGSALQNVEQTGRRREHQDTYVPTSERNRRWWVRFLMIGSGLGAVSSIVYLGRGWDDDAEAAAHPDIPNGWSPLLWWKRFRARFGDSVSYYQNPAFDKLLPDPDPSFSRPYTLCISLEDMLVHSEWSREHGWRVAKRPGFDYFIRYLSQYYEIVLFTSVPFGNAEALVQKLEPYGFITWPLFREATKFEEGEIVKDLSYLNRDLSKVFMIDTKPSHVRKQPENAIILEPWKGDPKDRELVSLVPFLEYVAAMEYPDVRKVLKSFDGKHIPTEFARREAIARQEFNAQLAKRNASHKPSGMGALGSLLGLKPGNMAMVVSPDEPGSSEAFAQGKMLQDLVREQGLKNYEMLEQQIRETGEDYLKQQKEAMEKAQKEAMQHMFGSFSFGGAKPDEPASNSKP